MADTSEIEKKNLEAHVELCAERYRHLDTKLQAVEEKVDGVQVVIREIHDMVGKIKDTRNQQIISWSIGVIGALGAVAAWFLAQYLTKI